MKETIWPLSIQSHLREILTEAVSSTKSGNSRGPLQSSSVRCSRVDTQVCPDGTSQLKHVNGEKSCSRLSWWKEYVSMTTVTCKAPWLISQQSTAVTHMVALSLTWEDSISIVCRQSRRDHIGQRETSLLVPLHNAAFVGQDGCTLCL